MDVVRFVKVREEQAVVHAVLRTGVAPETLSGTAASTVVHGYLDLLEKFGATDVEVEFRKSIYSPSDPPNPIADPFYSGARVLHRWSDHASR